MPDWLKKERCQSCREERAVRFCLRRNRDLGWNCCNGYRIDGKCPDTCQYAPQPSEGASPLPRLKSDSRTEFLDFLDRYLQIWMHKAIEALDKRTPAQLILDHEGKVDLKDWLGGFSYPDPGILEALNLRLGLDLPLTHAPASHPETLTAGYFDHIITLDWEQALAFHLPSSEIEPKLRNDLADDLAAHPVLKKTRRCEVINAGFTEDRRQAFVFCELNRKQNWTLIFAAAEGTWRLYQSIHGTLQDYYAQKNSFRELALALNANDSTKVSILLREARVRYPLCPDLYYYEGLFDLSSGRPDRAQTTFGKALALEPEWTEPLFRLALLDMHNKDFAPALLKWEKFLQSRPDDLNALNNLGVCQLGLEQRDQARAAWQQALKLDPSFQPARQNLDHLDHG